MIAVKAAQPIPFHQMQHQVDNKNIQNSKRLEEPRYWQDIVDTKDTTSDFFNLVHLLGYS